MWQLGLSIVIRIRQMFVSPTVNFATSIGVRGHDESYITSIEAYKQKIEETFRFGGETIAIARRASP